MGGTGNIINGFEKLMNEVGIEIIKGHEVKKIVSHGNKITGIQLDDLTKIETNNVICNADPPAVYEKMLNGNKSNSLMFKWKKKGWNIPWVCLYTILELKKLIVKLNIIQ